MASKVPIRTQLTPLLKDGSPDLPVYSRQYTRRTYRKHRSLKAAGLVALYAVTFSVSAILWWKSMFVVIQHVHPGLEAGGPDCQNPARMITGMHGAVASENQVCSEMGVDVLQRLGGSAVDALVTVTLCNGVTNMFSSGLGGGGFMTVRIPPKSPNHSSEVWAIDFRETAPAAATETMFVHNPAAARRGGLAVAVPGELKGLEEVHQLWGRVPWEKLVQPVADLARGWIVDRELLRRINDPQYFNFLTHHPDWAPIFAPNGRRLNLGDTIRMTALADTLEAIAIEGVDVFYKGRIAESIVRKIQLEGGIITMEDMASYKARVLPALSSTYRGKENYSIYTTHPPTSGGVLVHMLNLMERYENMVDEGFTGLNAHRAVEAIKFGFAARTKLSDFGFSNNTEKMAVIASKAYANAISFNITDDQTHTPEYYQPEFDIISDHGTSHKSIVDKDGMAVSLTSTVNSPYGALVLDPVTGVMLNNNMDDFSIPGIPNHYGLLPSPYNYPAPDKRPLSSMAPTILERSSDNTLYLIIGASGGSRIFPAIFHTFLQLEWGQDLLKAIQHARFYNQLFPTEVVVDSNAHVDVVEALIHRGHNVTIKDVNRPKIAAAVNAIVVERDGRIFAVSDPRKNGMAAGY